MDVHMHASCVHCMCACMIRVVCMNICIHLDRVQSSSNLPFKVLTLCLWFACNAAAA